MAGIKSYSLYLDSTGDPGWCPPFGKSLVNYYIVAGLAISPESNLSAYKETNRILEKYIPQTEWTSPEFELCYHHLIRGKGIYATLSDSQRLSLADEVFNLILRLEPILFASVIDKKKMKQRYGNSAYDPKLLGIRSIIHRFAMSLKRLNGVGSVVMDSEEYRKDQLIREMVQRFKKDGIIIRGYTYQPKYIEKIVEIIDTITFTDSNMSAGIQLADLFLGATWQHYERSLSRRFNQVSPLWDRKGTIIYEPVMIPK